jgi:hypothetical protein
MAARMAGTLRTPDGIQVADQRHENEGQGQRDHEARACRDRHFAQRRHRHGHRAHAREHEHENQDIRRQKVLDLIHLRARLTLFKA